jgi:hypothetical protein
MWSWCVRSLVCEEEVDSILNTPLLESVVNDTRCWKPDARGMFTVKSAYNLAFNNLIDTSQLHAHGDWSVVWSLEVPPMVKNFIWRMLRDCLPTRSKLITKKVQCPQTCTRCEGYNENSWHFFGTCLVAVAELA